MHFKTTHKHRSMPHTKEPTILSTLTFEIGLYKGRFDLANSSEKIKGTEWRIPTRSELRSALSDYEVEKEAPGSEFYWVSDKSGKEGYAVCSSLGSHRSVKTGEAHGLIVVREKPQKPKK